jgi:hypothetical protein
VAGRHCEQQQSWWIGDRFLGLCCVARSQGALNRGPRSNSSGLQMESGECGLHPEHLPDDRDFLDRLRRRDDLETQLVLELLAEPSACCSHVPDLTLQVNPHFKRAHRPRSPQQLRNTGRLEAGRRFRVVTHTDAIARLQRQLLRRAGKRPSVAVESASYAPFLEYVPWLHDGGVVPCLPWNTGEQCLSSVVSARRGVQMHCGTRGRRVFCTGTANQGIQATASAKVPVEGERDCGSWRASRRSNEGSQAR